MDIAPIINGYSKQSLNLKFSALLSFISWFKIIIVMINANNIRLLQNRKGIKLDTHYFPHHHQFAR